MKQWAIKTPRGKLRTNTARENQALSWREFMKFPDRTTVHYDLYNGNMNQYKEQCKAKGYKCVRVNVMDVSE